MNAYWYWKAVIPKEICDYIINTSDWEKSGTAKFNKNNAPAIDKTVRKTQLLWEHPLSVVGCILRSYITQSNKDAKWNYSLTEIEDIQLCQYVDGGHYKYHSDVDIPNHNKQHRKLSAILFLSEPSSYEGGDFEFEMQGANLVEKKPSKGSIIVFPSYLSHRVTPVISGIRYTAVAWALGPAFK